MLKDFANTKMGELYSPTPTDVAGRRVLLNVASLDLEVSPSDIRDAFMHANAAQTKYVGAPREQRVAGWSWKVTKAMNGMRTGSAEFNALTADVRKRIGFERAEADSQLYVEEGSTARIVFHVDDPIWVASKEESEQVWGDIGKHLRLKDSKYITGDEAVKFLGREYQRVRGHGRRGFRVRQAGKYIDVALAVLNMVGCQARSVPGRKLSKTDAKHIDNVALLDAEEHSKYRAGVGNLQYMLNEYPAVSFAVKCCSMRLATPTRADSSVACVTPQERRTNGCTSRVRTASMIRTRSSSRSTPTTMRTGRATQAPANVPYLRL